MNMKKIAVILSALLFLSGNVFSQATNYIVAPQYDNSTSTARGPNGTSAHAYMRGCALVLQSELTAIPNGSTISSFGFTLNSGTTINACTGTINIYLENTTDASYLKGTTWSTILTGMTNVYANVMTIPISATSTSITVTLSTPLVYNGGGIYVAYDWASTGAYGTAAAVYRCNSTGLSPGCASAASGASAPTTLGTTAFRPNFLFGIANTYTNEIQVNGIEAPGRIAAMFNTPHTISAIVRNASNITKTNISVFLNVTGANAASNTQTISSLAAGTDAIVTFPALNPQLPGLNTISVSVSADENNSTNSTVYGQSVTCNEWAINPATGSYTSNSVGFGTGAGILSNIYLNPVTSTLTNLRFAVSTNTPSIGRNLYGALLSSTGVILATTNTVTITNGILGTFVTFTFSTPPALTANTTYYLGMTQTANSTAWYPAGTQSVSYLPANLYYTTALTGGALTVIPQNFGYFGIEAIFNPTLSITVTSPTVTCGASATLLASSASNYSWSTGATTSSIIVSPTVTTGYSVITTNTMGCVAKASPSVIINPIPVSASANSTVICNGDQVSLTASGATTYTWSTGSGTNSASSIVESPSSTTIYTLSGADFNGCNAMAMITVSVNPLPVVNVASSASAICIGNTVTLSASGASTYAWDSGANTAVTTESPVLTTVYTVTGTAQNGCSKTNTLQVLVNSFTPGVTSSTAICNGTGITLSATGGTAYVWNTGSPFSSIGPLTPSLTTSYTVNGTGSNGCSGQAFVTVTVNPLPVVTATANRTTMCKNEVVNLSAQGATSYSWNTGATTAATSYSATIAIPKILVVTGTDDNGCSANFSITIQVKTCTGIEELATGGLMIYPNPASNHITVQLDNYSAGTSIEIYNMIGSRILAQDLEGEKSTVNISELSNGVYYLKVIENDKVIGVGRFVRE